MYNKTGYTRRQRKLKHEKFDENNTINNINLVPIIQNFDKGIPIPHDTPYTPQ